MYILHQRGVIACQGHYKKHFFPPPSQAGRRYTHTRLTCSAWTSAVLASVSMDIPDLSDASNPSQSAGMGGSHPIYVFNVHTNFGKLTSMHFYAWKKVWEEGRLTGLNTYISKYGYKAREPENEWCWDLYKVSVQWEPRHLVGFRNGFQQKAPLIITHKHALSSSARWHIVTISDQRAVTGPFLGPFPMSRAPSLHVSHHFACPFMLCSITSQRRWSHDHTISIGKYYQSLPR